MKHLVVSLFMVFLIAFNMEGQIITENDGFKWQSYQEYGYTGAKSENGKVIVPAKYMTCKYENFHFTVTSSSGLIGIFSKEGRVIIPANKYLNIHFFIEWPSIFIVKGPNGWGVKSDKGKEIIPEIYDAIHVYGSKDDYYFHLVKDGYSGIANDKGKIIISTDRHYNEIYRLGDTNKGFTYSFVIYGNKSGVCDSNGKEIIRTDYWTTVLKHDSKYGDYYEVALGNSLGKLSLDGKVLMSPQPCNKEYLMQGDNKLKDGNCWYIVCDETNRLGAKNSKREEIVPCKYNRIFISEDGSYFIVKEGIYAGAYSFDGKCIIPTSNHCHTVFKYKDLYMYVTEDNKTGAVDENGKVLVMPKHMEIDLVEAIGYKGIDGIIVACKDGGKWGAENMKGQMIIPCEFDNIGILSLPDEYYILAYIGSRIGLFTKIGQNLIPINYESITVNSYGNNVEKIFFYVKNGGKMGVFSEEGRQIINAETFSSISYNYEENSFKAIDGKRICTFDENGVLLSDNMPDLKRDEYISQADAEFEKGNYKSSASLYGKAIAIKPSASLYFNRGVSNYNRDKYIEAIEDFERCLKSNPTFYLAERSLDLIDKAKAYQAARDERRQQMAGAIFGLVLSTANLYFQSKMQQQTNRGSGYKGYQYDDESYDYDISSESGYSSSTSSSSQKKSSGAVCRICHGDGKCLSCHGDGIRTDNQFGTGQDPTKKCGVCGGTGICNICHGTGRKN